MERFLQIHNVNAESCRYCGAIHGGVQCSRISAIEYFPDGTVKRIEFHNPNPPVQLTFPQLNPIGPIVYQTTSVTPNIDRALLGLQCGPSA